MKYRKSKPMVILAGALLFLTNACAGVRENDVRAQGVERSRQTLEAIYKYYASDDSCLLRENYPHDASYKAGYLGADNLETVADASQNPYSYLWPFSGTLSAISSLYDATGDECYLKMFDEKCLGGLSKYHDTRAPEAYASYINTAPQSDRFYDDNVWIGIDLVDMYQACGRKKYLDMAKNVWKFIESGMDSVQGGGIYWCEQKRESKNTCSNAPGSVLALKLYQATGDQHYYDCGSSLYAWTKEHLQDPDDGLYFDNVSLDGKISRAKYSYNSGQMIQSAALLYKITGDSIYLHEARRVADASMRHFFKVKASDDQGEFHLLAGHDVWFASVLLRGIIELRTLDDDSRHFDLFCRNLDYAYLNARDPKTGLFHSDWSGKNPGDRKWLLTQAAMSEMFARTAATERNAGVGMARIPAGLSGSNK